MPITYAFDQDQGLILTRVTGELSIGLTQDYFSRLQQDRECPAKAIEIVDFSGVTDFAIDYGEMSTITSKYQRTKSTRGILATVFNCTSELSYGIARMLQTLHELANEHHVVIITRTREELTRCIAKLRSNPSYPDESPPPATER
jgi:hypothetical protein